MRNINLTTVDIPCTIDTVLSPYNFYYTQDGMSAMNFASQNGHLDVFQALVNANADKETYNTVSLFSQFDLNCAKNA